MAAWHVAPLSISAVRLDGGQVGVRCGMSSGVTPCGDTGRHFWHNLANRSWRRPRSVGAPGATGRPGRWDTLKEGEPMGGRWIRDAARLSAAGMLAAGLWAALAEPPARAYTPEQVAAGGQVYAASCAGCHGARGEGAGADDPEAPLLVGPRGLTGFRHVLELYEFTRDSMPQDQPGSLSAE